MKTLWEKSKIALQNRVLSHVFERWIAPLQPLDLSDNRMVLGCRNFFVKKRIKANFQKIIEEEVERIAGRQIDVVFEVLPHKPKKMTTGTGKALAYRDAARQRPVLDRSVIPYFGRILSRKFVFERFIVGDSCRFAYEAALDLASMRKGGVGALLFSSDTGMGKTHLAQAIGHRILEKFPRFRVMYITADDFTTEMTNNMRAGSYNTFKKFYREACDVLLLDDIHSLAGRNRTQLELLTVLDYLMEAGKRIVCSTALPLKDIKKFHAPLFSRMSQFINTKILPPDFDTRFKIVEHRSKERGCRFPNKVIEVIASELDNDVRLLESAVDRILIRCGFLGTSPSVELVMEELSELKRCSNLSISLIKEVVADAFQINVSDLESRSRKQIHAKPRHIAIFLARELIRASYKNIGSHFNRYHTSVIHSISLVQKEMKKQGEIYHIVKQLKKKLERYRTNDNVAYAYVLPGSPGADVPVDPA